MALRFVAIMLRQVLRLALHCCRRSRSKDVEILVLRQEIDVLLRQNPLPKIPPEERLVLALLQWLRTVRDRLSALVTPDTRRRWHRELARRKWRFPHRVVSRGTIGLETQLVVWRMARENLMWGYRGIQGERAKVGIEISATSIRRILASASVHRHDRPQRTRRQRRRAIPHVPVGVSPRIQIVRPNVEER